MGHNIDLSEAAFIAWRTVFFTGKINHSLKRLFVSYCHEWPPVITEVMFDLLRRSRMG